MRNLKKIYYFSGTHWDREWYNPFQGFRYKLVKITDEIIETLEADSDFSSFTFDGQTVVLDDYCTIRPENRERLINLIEQRRIHVGPWYVMPDEFLCSGESLIMNLQIGHSLAKNYGAPEAMKYGFVCDIFGHIGQLPQILNGFGIKGALLGRGTNDHTTPAHFLWEAYDNSSCVTFKVPEECGYGTFWYDVWAKYNPVKDPERKELISRACQYIENETLRSPLDYVVLMDSMDHSPIQPLAPWLAKELSKIYSCPVVFESLDNMVELILSENAQLTVKHGELIETAKNMTGHNMLIPYTLSSRYDIKKENDECQILLEKWASWFTVMTSDDSNPISVEYLSEAYKYLVKCHAHDSICGCSTDAVHMDMNYRFRQVKNISSEIIFDAITKHIPGSNTGADANLIVKETLDNTEIILEIWNSLPFSREEVIEANINFPVDYTSKYYEQSQAEKINSFNIYDAEDVEIPYTIFKIERGSFVRVHDSDYRQKRDIYTVFFKAVLNPLGKTSYRILPSVKPSRYPGKLSTSFNKAQNPFIKLEINDNGTFNIVCKSTGVKYENLHYFLDDGEIGDGWFHVSPLSNREISSKGFSTSIEKITDGASCCIFRVVKYINIPSNANLNNSISRSDKSSLLEIISDIKLTSDSKFVEIKTIVKNNVSDHRLRLVAISGIDGNTYCADQPFGFSTRQTGYAKETFDWKEYEKTEKAFGSLVWKKDSDGNGLLFTSKGGLHECAAYDDDENNILITLSRSFSTTFLTDGEKDGQLISDLEFNYSICPIYASDSFPDFLRLKDSFQTGIISYSYAREKSVQNSENENPLLIIESKDLVLSVIKLPEDKSTKGYIIRIFNPCEITINCEIDICERISGCFETNLLEEKLQEISIENSKIKVSFDPYKIKTYLLVY